MEEKNLCEQILFDLRYNKITECYKYLNENPQLQSKLWDDTLEYLFKKIKPSKIDTIEDLAKLLDNNDYYGELNNEYNIDVEDICRKNKWIICFPYSDDCFEVRGYIDDELGAYNGSWYKIYKEGDFYPDEEEDNTYHKAEQNMIREVSCEAGCDIKANWCNEKIYQNNQKYVWDIIVENENLPHAYFNIIDKDSEDDYESNEIWAKCCIIDCSKIL